MTPVEWYILGSLAYSGVEYWLGKTDKVKAGSAIELVLHAVRDTAGFFLKRK